MRPPLPSTVAPTTTVATNGWTGGQYSLFRAVLGVAFVAGCVRSLWSNGGSGWREIASTARSASPFYPWFPNPLLHTEAAIVAPVLLACGMALGVALALGLRDRLAAIGLVYVCACLVTRAPGEGTLPWAVGGLVLLAHVAVSPGPYGSWEARGRLDPGGAWMFPDRLHRAAWVMLALAYAGRGLTAWLGTLGLEAPALTVAPLGERVGLESVAGLVAGAALMLDLAFAPLALIGAARPWLWLALLVSHLAALGLGAGRGLTAALILAHGFAFDPAWVAPRRSGPAVTVYFDGDCGLCHRVVRFLLAEDRDGSAFCFAPLQGQRFKTAVPEPARATVPDSLVVQLPDGTLMTRSRATLEVGQRLGGVWRLAAVALGAVPRRLLDGAYDGVAHVRRHVFAKPNAWCPPLPPALRERFDV